MTKPFKTLEEQCNLLRSRNLIINDEDFSKRYLLHNNYYEIMNTCGKLFNIQNSEDFLSGTTFEEIVSVHCFETELKSILFKNIIEAESTLKSITAYIFSDMYRNDYNYLDMNNFKFSTDKERMETVKMISDISQLLARSIKHSKSVIHYINRHGNVPLWVLIHEFSLGQLIKFIHILEDTCTNKIAQEHDNLLKTNNNNQPTRLQIGNFETILNHILNVRNLVAHNKKIIGYKNNHNIPSIPHFTTSGRNNNTIYDTLEVLKIFLTHQQYAQMHNTILKRIKNLSRHLKVIDVNTVILELGFPTDWHLNTTKIPQ